MHSRDGAFSETLYIYQPVLDSLVAFSGEAQILSLGLGIGYNEILCACFEIKNPNCKLKIFSYESVSFLRDSFSSYFLRREASPLDQVYTSIINLCAKHFNLSIESIVTQLNRMMNRKDLIFRGALNQNNQPHEKFNGIFYDAFSSNTSPELWTEEFLNSFIKNNTSNPCCLSTYAATGKLKRALIDSGFEVQARDGFANKRESTLAHRD